MSSVCPANTYLAPTVAPGFPCWTCTSGRRLSGPLWRLMGQRGTGQSGREFTQCDRLGRGQPPAPPQALPRSPSSQLCLAHPPASPNLSLAPRWYARPLSPCTLPGTVPSAPRRLSFLIHPHISFYSPSGPESRQLPHGDPGPRPHCPSAPGAALGLSCPGPCLLGPRAQSRCCPRPPGATAGGLGEARPGVCPVSELPRGQRSPQHPCPTWHSLGASCAPPPPANRASARAWIRP